ncbi:MAG TPA: TetR/AcrR family transcriptional regulator [Parvibaculum sp.]|jgi:TetR/AcrR family transcriptional repressor of mexJK operon
MAQKKMQGARPDWLVPLDDPRDEEILSAAFDVFTEKGFHGATMLEVATRARASKVTLYRRFENKVSLLCSLLAWGCRRNMPEADEIERLSAGDPVETLNSYAVTVLTAMMRPESLALYRIVVAEGERLPEVGRIFDSFTREPSIEMVRIIGDRLVAAKICAIENHGDFADDFIGILRGDFFHKALIGARTSPKRAAIEAHARRAMGRLLKAYAVH